MVATKAASFLGLPAELRLEIYERVLQLDVAYSVLNGTSEDWCAYTPYGRTLREAHARLQLPWQALMLVCKHVRLELRHLMQAPGPISTEARFTYDAELKMSTNCYDLERLAWRKIPCPPARTTKVVAYLNVRDVKEIRFGGDGGVTPILQALYQSLNHLLHCGSTLSTTRPLKDPMRIKELVVVYDHGEVATTTQEDRPWLGPVIHGRTRHPSTFRSLCGRIGSILYTGILSGYIEEVRVCSTYDEQTKVVTEGVGLSDYWARAGFKWDVPRKDFTDYLDELPVQLLEIREEA